MAMPKANHNQALCLSKVQRLVLISSKNILKANHNVFQKLSRKLEIGFNILKEHIESKSQQAKIGAGLIRDWF